jgi:hypothetical protein
MVQVSHANGLVKPNGWTSFLNEKLNPDPPALAGNLSYLRHQGTGRP